MACRFGITAGGDDPDRLHQAIEDAFDEIDRIESLLSMYDPDSVLSGINRSAGDGPVEVDDELFELLLVAGTLWEQTRGAFDPTMGPLVRLWRQWRADAAAPDAAAIDRARQEVGMGRVVVDVPAQTVAFDRPGMEIDLGGIGKGYAVDRAVEILEAYGIEHCLVHGGTSTIAARGSMDSASVGWRIGMTDPADPNGTAGVVELRDEALACSNQQNQYYEHDGRKWGHVIDPRTGWPAPADASIITVCASATRTDALSTAMLVLGRTAAEQVARTLPDVRVHWLSGNAAVHAAATDRA